MNLLNHNIILIVILLSVSLSSLSQNTGFSAGIDASYEYYDLHQIYFDFLFQATLRGTSGMFFQFGYGAGIPIRLGIYKIPVMGEESYDDGRLRTFELQFLIGYLRHFKKG